MPAASPPDDEGVLSDALDRRWVDRLAVSAVIALCALVLFWRLPGVDPPSLYLDDQWVSIVVHHMSWSDFKRIAPPVPPAFIALERLFARLSSDPEWPLQVLPILANIALVPGMFWLARRLTASAGAGLLAAALVAADPTLAIFAVAAKQYATDALVVVVLLILGLPLLEEWSARRLWTVVLAALMALPLSFASVFVSVPLCHFGLLSAFGRTRGWRDVLRAALPPILLFDGAVVLFYFGLLRRQARGSMIEYWSDYFPESLTPVEVARFLAHRGSDFLTLALPGPLRWVVLAILPALVALAVRRRTRLTGLFFLAFYLQMAAAACLRAFPIGTGRADIFAHGVTLLLVAAGGHAMLTSAGASRRASAAVLGALSILLLLAFGPRSAYRTSGDDSAVVSQLEKVIQPSDGLIVYPLSTFALGVYGSWPIRLERWPAQGTGFEVVVDRPRTVSLHLYPGYETEPRVMGADLRAFLAGGYDRIVLMTATEAKRDPQVFIHQQLLGAGYDLRLAASAPPHLLLYEKTTAESSPAYK